ncbi:hypothetical protein [Marinobacter sp.]|uniref:hypothetical protein n=1 Tax=Marinobacter sp. TaxID=50741 RepID=UPI003A90A207
MAVESTVRWFHSEMAGAPVLAKDMGDLVAILDACLVDGFGAKTPDGDKITVAGGVATVEFSGGHDFEPFAVIEVSGATPSGLNDVWRVTSATATSFTFDCPAITDGIATGAISVRRPTSGYWEKAFSGVNKGAYRSTHPDSTGFFLRVDSSVNREFSDVLGYEAMTGIDSGTQPFPSPSDESYMRWSTVNSTSSSYSGPWWAVIDDGRFFWFISDYAVDYLYRHSICYQFGDIAKASTQDLYACVIGAQNGSNVSRPYYSTYLHTANVSGSVYGLYFARAVNDPGTGPDAYSMRCGAGVNQISDNFLDAPNPAHPGITFSGPLLAISHNTRVVRGVVPGLLTAQCSESELIDNPARIGRFFLVVPPSTLEDRPVFVTGMSTGSITNMPIGIDIMGPWR